jgi:hypothetical protein
VSPRVLAFDGSVVARALDVGPIPVGATCACWIFGCSNVFVTSAGVSYSSAECAITGIFTARIRVVKRGAPPRDADQSRSTGEALAAAQQRLSE